MIDKYGLDANNIKNGFYEQKTELQELIQIDQDIALKWSQKNNVAYQKIKAGEYLNITNPGNIFAVSQEDLKNNYKIVKQHTQRALTTEEIPL